MIEQQSNSDTHRLLSPLPASPCRVPLIPHAHEPVTTTPYLPHCSVLLPPFV